MSFTPPRIIAALHLPSLATPGLSMAWLEDYALANAAVFAEAGMPGLMLQDQTRTAGAASAESIAVTATLARLIRAAHPAMALGIIVQAHDAAAPLAIAQASGASFVRLKVFIAAAMTAEGPRSALAPDARAARAHPARAGIAVLADVFDRTSLPMVDMPPERAALWAEAQGADSLVLTGASFAESLSRVAGARAAGVRVPLLLGGGVTASNVSQALAAADGVIVSTALMLDGDGLVRWDKAKVAAFMDAARA